MIDWYHFSQVVEAGTQAKFLSRYSEHWVEGIILENQPFVLMDREEKSVFTQDALRFEGFNIVTRLGIEWDTFLYIEPERMLYRVNGKWLTLIQVMMRESDFA